jgi:hypothetical protein
MVIRSQSSACPSHGEQHEEVFDSRAVLSPNELAFKHTSHDFGGQPSFRSQRLDRFIVRAWRPSGHH